MTRFFTLLSIVALMAANPAQAQITYGGSPWSPSWNQDIVALPAIDRAALQAEDDVTDRFKEAPWRFGVEHDVQLNAVEHGAWSVEQGHRVWRLALEAGGATGMSVRFDAFRVPKGGTLFLAAADGSDFIGALDHRNMKDWGGLATGVPAWRSDWIGLGTGGPGRRPGLGLQSGLSRVSRNSQTPFCICTYVLHIMYAQSSRADAHACDRRAGAPRRARSRC